MYFRLLTIIFVVLISGCSWHATHHQNDRQGQLLPEKALSQLKKGMSPSEVTNLLGSAILYNLNDNRWEYIEYAKLKGKVTKNKHLVLTFKDDELNKIEKY